MGATRRSSFAIGLVLFCCLVYWLLNVNWRLSTQNLQIREMQHVLDELRVATAKHDEEVRNLHVQAVIEREQHAEDHEKEEKAPPSSIVFSDVPKSTKKTTKGPVPRKQRKVNLSLLYEHFGLRDDVDLKGKPKWHRHLDDARRFDLLETKEWTKEGTLVSPKRQMQPVWDKKEGKDYFKKYSYPSPHPCPGEPYECGGKGVCDSTRGVCVCHPPWTGWDCGYEMRPQTVSHSNDLTQADCKDQVITDERVEKWDKRTVERCAKNTTTNGMWLGLTDKMSHTIASSIANVLGVKKGDFVLDVGMGCGNLATAIAEEHPGAVMVGIDYSKEAVNFVRKELSRPHIMCVADVRNLAFLPDNSVDHIYENGVFSVTREGHCESYSDLVRALKPGGTFLIHQTYFDAHLVKCWQNISMMSVEKCLAKLGVRMEYILTRDLSEGKYDTYCAGETYTGLYRKG